jgi:CheY-like chemotaxis protein
MVEPRRLCVLLVEDDPDDVHLIRTLLQTASEVQYDLLHCGTVNEAQQRLQSARVDVVLSDLMLPDARGLDTLRCLRLGGVPVVVLTGLDDQEVGRQAVAAGADDFLVKGEVDARLLSRTLMYAVHRHRSRAELQEGVERLRIITEQVPAVVWTTDTQLRFTACFGRGLFRSASNSPPRPGECIESFFGQDASHVPAVIMHRQALSGHALSNDLVWGDHWYHAHIEPLRDAQGQIVGTIGVALDITDQRQLEHTLRDAQRVQRKLFPKTAPRLPGLALAGRCEPALAAGGDYYDFFTLQDETLGVVIGDVAGHGLGAALLMAETRAALRALARVDCRVDHILSGVAALLAMDLAPETFVTLMLVKIDPSTGTLQYASAGHEAYVLDSAGRLRTRLTATAPPINVLPDSRLPMGDTFVLDPDDLVVLPTDGMWECRRDRQEPFGIERLLGCVRAFQQQPVESIVSRVFDTVRSFLGNCEASDDMTLIIVRRDLSA